MRNSVRLHGGAMSIRHTIVAHGQLLRDDLKIQAARSRLNGRQIMTFEALACRLAGGFARPIDDESLREAIQKSLPEVDIGELEAIKDLPGLIDAAAGTLRKAWRAGIDLQVRALEHKRISSLAALEEAVLERLPVSMMRPVDLAEKGMARIHHAGAFSALSVSSASPNFLPAGDRCSTRSRSRSQ